MNSATLALNDLARRSRLGYDRIVRPSTTLRPGAESGWTLHIVLIEGYRFVVTPAPESCTAYAEMAGAHFAFLHSGIYTSPLGRPDVHCT